MYVCTTPACIASAPSCRRYASLHDNDASTTHTHTCILAPVSCTRKAALLHERTLVPAAFQRF
jgi:hypothetical protein